MEAERLLDVLRALSKEREPAVARTLDTLDDADLDNLIAGEESGASTAPLVGAHPFGLGDAKALLGLVYYAIKFVAWVRRVKPGEPATAHEHLVKLLEEHGQSPEVARAIADEYSARIARAA